MGRQCPAQRCGLGFGNRGETGANGYGRLDTAQERRRVDDGLELASLPRRSLSCSCCGGRVILAFSLPQKLADSLAGCACLVPSRVCERGVVGGGRGKVPLLVGGVEAVSVSARREWHSLAGAGSNVVSRMEYAEWHSYLTTKM